MFYVYEVRIVDTGEVIYIGKGTGNRYKAKKKNNLLNQIISQEECEYIIAAQYNTEEEAFEAERQRINELKKIGQAKCNRATSSIGGVTNCWTDERRKLMSENNPMKAEEQRQRMSLKNPMKNSAVAKQVAEKNKLLFEIDGKKYSGLQAAAEEYGVTIQAIVYWLDRGYTRDRKPCQRIKLDTQQVPVKAVENEHTVIYDGVEYARIKDAAKIAGCAHNTMLSWLKRGCSPSGIECRYKDDEAEHQYVNLKSKYSGVKKAVIVDGMFYESIAEASRSTGYSTKNLDYYLNHAVNPPIKCSYVNQQPSGTNFDNSSTEGSTTNG